MNSTRGAIIRKIGDPYYCEECNLNIVPRKKWLSSMDGEDSVYKKEVSVAWYGHLSRACKKHRKECLFRANMAIIQKIQERIV